MGLKRVKPYPIGIRPARQSPQLPSSPTNELNFPQNPKPFTLQHQLVSAPIKSQWRNTKIRRT
ncbi:hypothetical protein GBA52_002771 [Prunus armeniaca]|nr:hypothetical protein GBA52_002771 [Prunus armeniaca]